MYRTSTKVQSLPKRHFTWLTQHAVDLVAVAVVRTILLLDSAYVFAERGVASLGQAFLWRGSIECAVLALYIKYADRVSCVWEILAPDNLSHEWCSEHAARYAPHKLVSRCVTSCKF